MAIPTLLTDICAYLSTQNIVLSQNNTDGRINSSANERQIIDAIKTKFAIDIPKDRNWCDFSFESNGILYPVNIKVTETTHADNLSCKLGIYYALTGILPDFPNEVSYAKFFEQLHKNIGKNEDRDYYFLIINKTNTADVFCNSLKGLSTLVPNGKNLPFQANWGINRNYQNRKFKEATDFIMKYFAKSIILSNSTYVNFKKYFPQYVPEYV